MRHIANDHIKTIIQTNFTTYRQINSQIKDLIKDPTSENKVAVKELRKVKYMIGQSIGTIF